MTKEIENIIMNKKFFELTAEEKNLIREFAETEVDFEQLKFVFTQLEGVKNTEKPHVNKAVKANLDVLFDKTYAHKRLVWYNKLWLFLWPEETRFYARPLVQFATVLVLIVSVVTLVPFNEKPQLAMNETKDNSPNEKSVVEPTVVEDVKEESLDERIEQPNEEVETRELEALEMKSENGWELAKGETTTTTVDALESERIEQPTVDFYSGASALDLDAPGIIADEVVSTKDMDDVALSRSVTTTQPKAFSPKEKPEVFDILTALY